MLSVHPAEFMFRGQYFAWQAAPAVRPHRCVGILNRCCCAMHGALVGTFGVLIFPNSTVPKILPTTDNHIHPQTTTKMICNHHARLKISSLYVCRGQ